MLVTIPQNFMNYQVQLNYYKDEDGEYTDPGSCNLDKVKKIIEENWPNESYLEDLKVILISNNHQYLVLKNCKKGVFEVYFTGDDKFYYHKKSRIKLINHCVHLFMKRGASELKSSLNKKVKKGKSDIHDFFIDHNYRIKRSRSLKELKWFFTMGLPLTLLIIYLVLDSVIKGNFDGSTLAITVIYSALALYLWIPGILLHCSYLKDNKGLLIRLTKGNPIIYVEFKDITKQYEKSDIEFVHRVANDHSVLNSFVWFGGPPWTDYGYLNIKFKNGDTINVTNLLTDQLFIFEKFKYDNVKKLKSKRLIPWLEQRTKINGD